MDKYSLDYDMLDKKLSQRKAFRYEDVKDRLVKVAFDIVRFRDSDNIDGLWQIQATDDGEVIVAMYEDESKPLEVKASACDWNAVADRSKTIVNVFYKKEPVFKFAASQIGIPREEIDMLVDSLPSQLISNANLRKALLNELPADEKAAVLRKYPELNE